MSVRSLLKSTVLGVLLATCGIACAEPADPEDDSLVVLRVQTSPEQAELLALERGVAQSRADPIAVEALVDAYLRIGRRSAEPRYFGRAEAVLSPWIERPHTAAGLLLRMADIRQYRHEYERALELIERVLDDDPRVPQALLMRASIRQTQGRFDQAHTDCRTLLGRGEPILGTVCLAQTLGMTGSLTKAQRLLESLLERSNAAPPAQRVWMLTALADMEERLGHADQAELRLRQALGLDPDAHYARLALADLLLDRGRSTEISALLASMPRSEGMLLRVAEAERQDSSSRSAGKALQVRFEEAALRGERLHRRDLARLQLRLMKDERAALALARENWNEQREPVDARLLAEAAVAMRDSAALAELREWRVQKGYEDRTLERILGHAGES